MKLPDVTHRAEQELRCIRHAAAMYLADLSLHPHVAPKQTAGNYTALIERCDEALERITAQVTGGGA